MHSVLHSKARRVSIIAALAVTVVGLAAWRAPFHLHLLKSTPEANATVAAAPDSIRLWFSQAPELKVTTVTISGPGSAAIPLTPLASRDADAVVAGVKGKMPVGVYTVTWRTMARDGHVARGTFAFTVGAAQR
jgi:copper resistance protein C